MIANATAHRRANAFADALDARAEVPGTLDDAAFEAGPPGEGRSGRASQARGAHAAHRHADAEQDRLLALAEGLSKLPSPTMDPTVKTEQRALLVAAMEQAFAGGTFDPARVRIPGQRTAEATPQRGAAARLSRFRPRSRWGRRLAASGLAVSVAAGSFSGAAVASTDALPGDTLYGLKRGMEDLRVSIADGETGKGEVHLDLASTRMKEVRRLMERLKAGPLDHEQIGDVRSALAGMHQEASEGHRLLSEVYHRDGSLEPIQALAAFSDEQRNQWADISRRLPRQLTTERDKVDSVLAAIEQDVVPLRPLLPAPKEDPGRGAQQGRGTGHNRPDTAPGRSLPEAPGVSAPPHTADKPTEQHPDAEKSSTPDASESGVIDEGGLLEPSPSAALPTESGKEEPQPTREITLPPLLPGLLPGITLGEDENG